jgi:histidinol dehydrogenase
VELLGEKEVVEPIVEKLDCCGIAYANLSSSLGDYCVVGRGCGDPTQGTARYSSGVSPWLFMKMQACVLGSLVQNALVQQGKDLAEYEGLLAHKAAIQEFEF